MDLILMLFFSYKNYTLAKKNGEPGFKWAVITSLVWIVFEITGAALYAMIAEVDLTNLQEFPVKTGGIILVLLFGIACGYLGYLLVRRSLNTKSPQDYDET